MHEYGPCPSCDGEITEDSDFCPHCGILFEKKIRVPCDTHSQGQAVGVCILCRALLCHECVHTKGGRRFCSEHRNVKVEQDWALIFQSNDINEAELVRSFLESISQQLILRNFTPHGFVWDGGGDSLFSRQAVNRPAKLFVPIPDYVGARKALEEWEAAGQVEG